MARSLNKVMLIGNLTRDPELRYTPSGSPVVSFGLATNRSWVKEDGTKSEDTEFHRIIAWNKLAELCSQLLVKGRKVYIEGRIATHEWEGQDKQKRQTTEIVADSMLILDSRKDKEEVVEGEAVTEAPLFEEKEKQVKKATQKNKTETEDVNPDDIPF